MTEEMPSDEGVRPVGRLLADGRIALTELLSRGTVLASTKPELYATLVGQKEVIQDVLADLELEMQLDTRRGVIAVVTQVEATDDDDDEGSPRLMRRRRLSLYDTFIALILRQHYREREQAGDAKIFIDVDQIQLHLMPFLPLTNSDARDKRTLNASIKKFKEMNLLAAVRGDDSRVEVTPVIRMVVDLNWLDVLLEKYRELANKKKEAGGE